MPGAICAAAVILTGCGGGSGEGLDANGRPIVPGSGDSGTLTADFQSIQDHVFTPVCTVCHAGGAAPQGLRLDAANSYAMLVGTLSNEVSSVLRVAPGRPGDSYLIQKLEGGAAFGARMPLGGPYLDAATMATIRQWLAAGALPSAAARAMPIRLWRLSQGHNLKLTGEVHDPTAVCGTTTRCAGACSTNTRRCPSCNCAWGIGAPRASRRTGSTPDDWLSPNCTACSRLCRADARA